MVIFRKTLKNASSLFALILLILTLIGCSSIEVEQTPVKETPDPALSSIQKVDSYFTALDDNTAGVAVLMAKDGKVVYKNVSAWPI